MELAALGELAEAGADRDEGVAREAERVPHQRLGHVVDAVLVQPETVEAIGPLQQQADVLTDTGDKQTATGQLRG